MFGAGLAPQALLAVVAGPVQQAVVVQPPVAQRLVLLVHGEVRAE